MRRGRSHIRGSCDICIARSVSGYARHLLCRRGCIYAQRGILYCVFRAGLPSVFTLRAGCFAASVFGPAEAVAADRRRGILFLCRAPLPVVCYVVRGYATAALFRRAGVRTRCFGENYYTISGVDCQIFLHAAESVVYEFARQYGCISRPLPCGADRISLPDLF